MTKTSRTKPIIHIGPPKTATVSLHASVIPHLGRPYLLKPFWTKALARSPDFDPPGPMPADIILSDERLGDFVFMSPSTIAERLSRCLRDAIVVFIKRDPLQQFYSFYRQGIRNGLATHSDPSGIPLISPDEFFEQQKLLYSKNGRGFLAMAHPDALSTAFGAHFDFQTVDFELLKIAPSAFVEAFSAICGSDARPSISHENRSSLDAIEEALNSSAGQIATDMRTRIINLFAFSRLSPDREDFLRNWRGLRSGEAFADAFRFQPLR